MLLTATSEFFFCASGPILFNLSCTFAAHFGKSLCSFSFGKVSIDYLFDNLEYEKRNDCFGKRLELWIQKSV